MIHLDTWCNYSVPCVYGSKVDKLWFCLLTQLGPRCGEYSFFPYLLNKEEKILNSLPKKKKEVFARRFNRCVTLCGMVWGVVK